jgi:ribose 5-phosphate isomerase A
MTEDPAKKAAGEAAAMYVKDGMRLGLGTGSTVAYFLEALAARGLNVSGVPTSEQTAAHCTKLGITLLDPSEAPALDICIDGADELDEHLNLTKGGGGALLREKVVASLAASMIVIATQDKVVARLGDTFAIPLEVVPFAVGPVSRTLATWGFEATVRGDGDYRTDNGNAIIDARTDGGLEDPAAFEAQCLMIPGVAECGIFTDLATSAILGSPDGSHIVLTAPTD